MPAIETRRMNFGSTTLERRDLTQSSPGKLRGVIPFNVESERIWTPWGDLVEIIREGAFDHAIRSKQDVRALWNHDPKEVLGRTAAGTLSLWTDSVGLHYEALLPQTRRARDLVQWVERGDVSGSSFGFTVRPDGERFGQRLDGSTLRELLSVNLWDVSPVTYPAYSNDVATLALTQLALNP